MNSRSRQQRNCLGGSLVEFNAVFMVFILLVFLPFLDFVAFCVYWGVGAALNFDSCREAANVKSNGSNNTATYTAATDATAATQRQAAVTTVETNWSTSGLGHFCQLATPIQHTITSNPATYVAGKDQYVRVDTTIQVKPFLSVPFPMQISGLNAPIVFTYSQERLVENN